MYELFSVNSKFYLLKSEDVHVLSMLVSFETDEVTFYRNVIKNLNLSCDKAKIVVEISRKGEKVKDFWNIFDLMNWWEENPIAIKRI